MRRGVRDQWATCKFCRFSQGLGHSAAQPLPLRPGPWRLGVSEFVGGVEWCAIVCGCGREDRIINIRYEY